MKNTAWIICSVLICLLSPPYGGAENIAPEKHQVEPLTPATHRIITIQVGSFKKAEDAEKDLARLTDLGLDAFTDHELVKDKGMWHRLYIGRFESHNAATEYANNLVDKGIISGYWVRKKQAPVKIEKQPETDQNEIQAPVADLQIPEKKTEPTSNEIPAAITHMEVSKPPQPPEIQKTQETPVPKDEEVHAEPDVVEEKTPLDSVGKSETGKRESRISVGLKASILYAFNADDFKVTRFDDATGGESWTFANDYGFVGITGGFNVYEGWSVEAGLEKDATAELDIWQFLLGPRYEFRQMGFLTPFARAGIVLGRIKWDDDPGSFDNGIGLDAGLGATLIKSNFQFGLEMSLRQLKYKYNKPADDTISSTQDNLDMSGIVFSGSITYLF